MLSNTEFCHINRMLHEMTLAQIIFILHTSQMARNKNMYHTLTKLTIQNSPKEYSIDASYAS